MATRSSGLPQGKDTVVYTVDAGSATISATVTAFVSIDGYDTIRIHNYGVANIYARVTLDGTNYTPGNLSPQFTKVGGSTNAVLSANEIGTLTGPFKGLGVMALTAGSAKAVILFR